MEKMKRIQRQDEKIGIALTEEEFDDIHSCVEEVASRMDTSADKGWGGLFIKKQVHKLKQLAKELKSIRKQQEVNNVETVKYEGLPEEACKVCE
jgi:DNA repair exonuclease SbcCD ATPase subunit